MLILAFDTSMAACSACVYDTQRAAVLAQAHALMDKGQAEALAPMVRDVIAQAGIGFAALNRIAVTTGPGTFTGVRIGLAFARGLGVSLRVPVVGVNSLAAIAANEKSRSHPIVVVSDARGGEVYVATFDAAGHELTPPSILRREDVAAMLPAGRVRVLGSGAGALLDQQMLLRSGAGDLPVAANFVRNAADLPTTEFPPQPLYLRPPDVKLPIAYTNAGPTAAGLLAQIHAECFAQPWTTIAFSELLSGAANMAMLAFNHQDPTGFVLFRRAADEAEIITICTRPAFRQRGLARALVQHSANLLTAQGIRSLFIEVAVSNVVALALYRACGFETVGLRKNYYERDNGLREDAHIMRKGLAL